MNKITSFLRRLFGVAPSAKDIALTELFKQPISEWLQIEHDLNGWDWPKQLMHIKPDWWLNCETLEDWKKDDLKRKHEYLKLIDVTRVIRKVIGEKKILHYHNVVLGTSSGKMTEEEFKDFWRGNYEGDKEAGERYYKRLGDRQEEKHKSL